VKEIIELFNNYKISTGPLTLEHLRILKGANYFSSGPVVHMRVNLNEYDEVFTNTISGFYERLAGTLPTLIEHHCSEGVRGGFFMRVQEGTLLGHVIEHVAIELQTLAGMDVSYGKTRSSLKQGVYNIIFRFFDEYAGLYAGKAALNLVNAVLNNDEFPLMNVIEQLIFIREKHQLGPATQAIVHELNLRNIPWMRLDDYNLIQIGTGIHQQRIRATLTPQTSMIAVEISQDRALTNMMLKDAGLPVSEIFNVNTAEEIKTFLSKSSGKYSVFSKNRNSDLNFSFPVDSEDSVELWKKLIWKEGEEYIMQPVQHGNILRLLVIGNNCCAVACITLPSITGNGTDNIKTLIQKLNQTPGRQKGDKGALSYIYADTETKCLLTSEGYDLHSVPENGKIIVLKSNPNPNNGSISENITSDIHPEYKALAVKASQITGFDVAAVNIITPDFSKPPSESGAFITEIHASPNFRMYIHPAIASPEPIIPIFVDHVVKNKKNMHIPLISITGSSGKTSCSKILFHCLKSMGMCISMSNSEGLFLSGKKQKEPELVDPKYVQLILRDTEAEIAIAETPVENILHFGLGYQAADFGIVLNIDNTHLNEIDIKRTDDLAYAKSVVAEEVRADGYAILNADEPLIAEMQERIGSRTAWISMHPDAKQTQKLVLQKSTILIFDGNQLHFHHQGIHQSTPAMANIVKTITDKQPLVESVLAALLTLMLMGIGEQKISDYLNQPEI